MPFVDSVASISGRNSRASNRSANTATSYPRRPYPPSHASGDAIDSAGIRSMLRTTTDTGDIGVLSFNRSRLPGAPHPSQRRHGPSHKPPASITQTSQHSYAPSQISKLSSQRDATSIRRKGSFTSLQSMPHSLPPTHPSMSDRRFAPLAQESFHNNRSYSLTTVSPRHPLPRSRSTGSLQELPDEPLKQSYRPPIPYFSYSPKHPPGVPHVARHQESVRPLTPGNTQGSPHLLGPPGNAINLQMRPRPRPPPLAPHSPQYPGPVHGYQHSMHNARGQPPANFPTHHRGGLIYPSYPTRPYHTSDVVPTDYPITPQFYPQPVPIPSNMPVPRNYQPVYRPQPMQGYQVSGNSNTYHHGSAQYDPAHDMAHAHSMFHNAARMSRRLPQRAVTPALDESPVSSDLATSGSAPASSNPSTPADQNNVAGSEPVIAELPDSISVPLLTARYFAYADGLEKPFDDSEDVEVQHPSVPPLGFVQRVKAMLESKAVSDRAATRVDQVTYNFGGSSREQDDITHELAANGTPLITVIEEYKAPAELSASPVRSNPDNTSSSASAADSSNPRITREMIRQETLPSSTDTTNRVAVPARKPVHSQVPYHNSLSTEVSIPKEPSNPQICTAFAIEAEVVSPPAAEHVDPHFKHIDSSLDSDETHSEDPFALDADTITIKQQHNAETGHTLSIEVSPKQPAMGIFRISSIKYGEGDTSRYSAISPLQTQLAETDEPIASREVAAAVKIMDAGDLTGGISSDSDTDQGLYQTPHKARSYSKSVQFRPISDNSDTGSHRLSLPGDLSTVINTTLNSTTEMVTDVAIRFSLPQTAVSGCKPCLVDVSNASTPAKTERDKYVDGCDDHNGAPRQIRKTSSIAFVDEIPPLRIVKKIDKPRESTSGVTAQPARSMSVGSVRFPQVPVSETRDVIIMNARPRCSHAPPTSSVHERKDSRQLSDLKEVSNEDMSSLVHHRRSSNSHFSLHHHFPIGMTIHEKQMQDAAESSKARRSRRSRPQPLSELRDLPSLNFSRMDLVDKLNEALSLRATRSMDIVSRQYLSAFDTSITFRPRSIDVLRDRYISFFEKTVEINDNDSDLAANDDAVHDDAAPSHEADGPEINIDEGTIVEQDTAESRSSQQQGLLDVVNEVNRLSIPSVNSLSEKISELIPGLRNLQYLRLDSLAFADDFDPEKHNRPQTGFSSRTSAGLHTLADRANKIVQHGTVDVDSVDHDRRHSEGDLQAIASTVIPALTEVAVATARPTLRSSVSAPTNLGMGELKASLEERRQAPTNEQEVLEMLPREMNPLTRKAKQALLLSHPNISRPWNLDESYPWTDNQVNVRLDTPRTGQLESRAWVRRSKSLDLTVQISDMSTLPLTETNVTSEIGEGKTASTTQDFTKLSHSRKQSKRSIIESITRKLGLTSYASRESQDRSITTPVSQYIQQQGPQKTQRGDRYPTTSLTEPLNFNIEDVRSYFSDHSSDHAGRSSIVPLRVRLTQLRGRHSRALRHSFDNGHNHAHFLDLSTDDTSTGRNGAHSAAANTSNGFGMSRAEFRIKRLGDCLRLWWLKSGDLLRSLSARTGRRDAGRKRSAVDDEDWLADSLYSGV